MKNILLTFTLLGSTFLLAQTDASLVSNQSIQTFHSSSTTSGNELSSAIKEDKKITYEDHLHEAQSFDIPLIFNYEQMDSLILSNKLIAVPEESETFKVQKLTHSKAYLNEVALTVLNEISSKFFTETQQQLSISSLTRTVETQNKLRRINSNAAKGETSHAYGASFDISYSKYGDRIGRNYANERMLQTILDQLVEEGKIYYIKERRQPCFHITVRNTKNIS